MKKYVKPTIQVLELSENMRILAGSGADAVNNFYEEDQEQL